MHKIAYTAWSLYHYLLHHLFFLSFLISPFWGVVRHDFNINSLLSCVMPCGSSCVTADSLSITAWINHQFLLYYYLPVDHNIDNNILYNISSKWFPPPISIQQRSSPRETLSVYSGVYNGLMGLIDQSACWWDALTLSAPRWDLNAVFIHLNVRTIAKCIIQ